MPKWYRYVQVPTVCKYELSSCVWRVCVRYIFGLSILMADDVLERARQAALTIAEALPVRKARTAIEPAMSFHPTLSTTSGGS